MKYLLCLIVFALACAEARPPDPLLQRGEMPPEGKQCLQRDDVQHYLAQVKEFILAQWQFPAGMAPDQKVDILFSIRETGELGGYLVPDALTQEIEDSAVEAIQAAAPFPPLPDDAACLNMLPIRATFSNPSRR